MRLDSILNNLGVAVMVVGETGNIAFVNGACACLLGRDAKSFQQVFPGFDWELFKERLADRCDQPRHQLLLQHEGRMFDAFVSVAETDPLAVVIELGEAGAAAQTREADLLRTQQRLRLAQEASATAFFEYLPVRESFLTSDVGAALVGLKRTSFTSTEALELVLPSHQDALKETFETAVRNQANFEIEVPIQHGLSNDVRWLLLRGDSRRDLQNGEWTMLGTFRDITGRIQRRDQLEASRALLAEAESLSGGFSFEWRIGEDKLTVSPNFHELSGIPASQPLTRDLLKTLLLPQEKTWVLGHIRDAIRRKRSMRLEHGVQLHSGEERRVELVCKPQLDETGEVVRLVGAARDITELKEAQQARLRSEQIFRSFMESVPAYVSIKDQNNRYRFANRAMERDGGRTVYDYSGIEGKTTREVYPEAQAAEIEAEEAAIMESGVAQEVSQTIPLQGGGEVHLEGVKFPIRVGSATLLGGFFLDVTDRLLADREKERMMSAIEHSGEMIVITDVDGAIVYVNPMFEQIMGYTREEVIGGHNRMWRSGYHDEAFYERAWEELQQGKVWQGSLINRKKDGSLIHEETTISPVRGKQGEVTGYVEVKRDVTRQKELEQRLQQSQKMESIGTLAGGVAHDYNNVLQTILGNTELLLEALEPSTELTELALEVKKAAEQSASLTSQLLAFARKQMIRPRPANVNDEFGNMKNMLQRLIGSHIQLTWQPSPDLWNVHIDPSQLQQVVTNICVNSRDAIGSAGEITVRTGNVPMESCHGLPVGPANYQDYVRLDISDNGCGMTDGEKKRAFEPFFTTKAIDQGTGLGLATVYGIVKQNRGYVFMESAPGKGTTVSILLPRYGGTVETAAVEEASNIEATAPKHVLVVEDEEPILKLVERALARAGYRVARAAGPREALSVAPELDRLDLVLTDIIMPTKNGKELVDELKAFHPGVQVLFMSGYSADILQELDAATRDRSFLQKPFSRKQLLERVNAVLQDA